MNKKKRCTLLDRFIRKAGKFLKVLQHFIHVLQYYAELNNGHHNKPNNLFVRLK